MKKLFLMSLVFLSTMLAAQKPVEIKLWPNGAPNTNNMTQQAGRCRSTTPPTGMRARPTSS